ncbi:MAG TPA: ATP-binding protein [Myxococcota bacterium]|nr:ATP-binding protein [Myxococcota bacterium]HQK51095.1 ATP-binding protein [Myxococcota bacterium]
MRGRIGFRVMLAVAIALALGLGAGSYLAMRHMEHQVLEEVHEGGHRLSDLLVRSLRHAMLRNDRESIGAAVRDLATGEDLSSFRIFNKDGVVAFSSDPSEAGRTVPTTDDACRGCHAGRRPLDTLAREDRATTYRDAQGHRLFTLVEPLYNAPDCSSAPCHVHPPSQKVLGVVDLTLSLRRMETAMGRFREGVLIGALVLMAGLSAVVVLLLMALVTRPVRRLVRGIHQVTAGDLDARVADLGDTELGEVARAFNEMTARLKETRGRLLQTERLGVVGRLAAGIAHEINNPLTGVMLIAGNLKEGLDPKDPRRGDLETLYREAARAREIVKGLLDFARQVRPNWSRATLDLPLGQAVEMVRHIAQKQGVDLTVEGPPLPEMRLDVPRMQQVLVNLMVNALDAMPDGGRLQVHKGVSGDGRSVWVDVADTGSGIRSEDLAHLFEPFFTTKEGKGTGLGLSISWGIVRDHGGQIDVESEPGRGTTFRVFLPLQAQGVDGAIDR